MNNWKDIEKYAKELSDWFDEQNGKFPGKWSDGYALHHCQVSEDPFNFFVLATNMVGKEVFNFSDKIIINPEILEKPIIIQREVPKRDFQKSPDGSINIAFKKEMQDINNVVPMPEACMSFPDRTKKNVDRFYRIKVRYQVKGLFGLKTKEEWIEGLKAHVFQHEVDHANGLNIYHGNKRK